MKYSLRLGTIAGIEIKVHATFAIIVALGAGQFASLWGAQGALFGVILVCAIFACVLLHELGHSLVAQRLGIPVYEIVLLPIGGVARLGREPAKPMHELGIAVAGPLVNVALAIVFALIAIVTIGAPALGEPPAPQMSTRSLLVWLFLTNVGLAFFNMIPALPMDGGRVLRALLALAIGRARATNIAAAVGQVIATSFVAFGILRGQFILTIIGVFVFFAATQERSTARARQALSGLLAGQACDPYALVLSPSELIQSTVQNLLRSPQQHYAVMQGNALVGVLSRDDALAAAARPGFNGYVTSVMRSDFIEVDAMTPLEDVRSIILTAGGRPVVVRGSERVLGLLGLDDLVRITAFAEALQRSGLSRPPLRRPSDVSPL
jgi:Zn-dependent protease